MVSSEIACHECDLLIRLGTLQDGDSASCPRCGGFLTQYRSNAYSRVLAFAISALILLFLANSFSFLSFAAGGAESHITLRQTPAALWTQGMPFVGMLVGAFIIAIPAVVLCMLTILSLALHIGYHHRWLPHLAKWLMHLHHWSMAEVFIIGVIVALVKLSSMATVVVGVSFWAYAGFTICFLLAVTSLDKYQCWERLDEVAGR